jgi:hypothetical protein
MSPPNSMDLHSPEEIQEDTTYSRNAATTRRFKNNNNKDTTQRKQKYTYDINKARKIKVEDITNTAKSAEGYQIPSIIMNNFNKEGLNWFGDKLQLSDKWHTGEYMETMRICSVNINGISKALNWLEWETLLKDMYWLQIDVLGVVEPNINFHNSAVLLQLKDIAKAQDRAIQIATSCSNQLNSSVKKMGGTMTIMAGRWACRKQKVQNDSKGRWSMITLIGANNRLVTIITAYRVCQQKGGEGGTVFHQQQLDFEEDNQRHVNLCKQFCIDLTLLIQRLHSSNHIVVLLGDFNDDLNLDTGQINILMRDCGLVNTIHTVEGVHNKLPPTYHRGKKCLDMIAITDSFTDPTSIVINAGYFTYYHHFQTDHRAIYCDLDTSILFGKLKIDRTRQSYRAFTTNNVKKCERFKTILRDLYSSANILNRVEQLDKRFRDMNEETFQSVVDDCITLEQTTSELLKCAGRQVRSSKYSNSKPFSDELSLAAREFKKQKNLLRYLLKKQEDDRNEYTEKRVRLQIQDAYRSLKEIQRNTEQERKAFLQRLADKRAGEWNLSQNAALNVIMQAEASKKTFERHGSVMKEQKKGSIENLTIPVPRYALTELESNKVGWETIDDEEMVFSLLLQKNAQQLMQSSESPFSHGPLVEDCGIDGNGKLVRRLLEGTLSDYDVRRYSASSSDSVEELHAFIRALAKPNKSNGTRILDFDWEYGIKEFRATFRRTRESTSCGPSGLNMSYWKAVSEDNDIARVHSFLIEKAFRHGFSYSRWQESWHCMLKKKDKPYIHRLRIIQLFEGDFNGALKYLLGRLLMYHVVETKECDRQAFGSIPGRTAHDALITLQLIYDNARVNKSVMASMFNDAAGCYDRIRPLLSSICMQRVGCPSAIGLCHSVTQRKMLHRVKTN